ncbi:MAG TPA: DUF4365 domain-containing protein [Candidatus Eisenbergiella merdipullorum]|uniref:DUF4365 domain-containing protein n=1 Tax=Candidatus Eisenbergiella merdipullorum TaxID=2838553 RepID=A0A9D2I9F0_9FIRM|nr:DUF4365 domain-containing protein [Candidatus Eisenbergiella merdipullorum]
MHIAKIKEDISISYISALCAYAGIAYEIVRHDDDSTDGILRKRIILDNNRKYDAELRIQLKCTSASSQYADLGNSLTYRLKVKNYNDLCLPSTTPIILGLLVLPEDEKEWILWSREELLIRGCMYWAEFSGASESENAESVTVRIDKKQILNAETLSLILKKIAREEWP